MNRGHDYEADWQTVFGEQRMPPRQASAGHDTDRYNGALMRTDPRLVRLMKAYTKLDEAGRDELIIVAESAASWLGES